ncbi:MAG: sulfatase-like hydrolase/transferase, partial [Rikenellaceae bacterium]
MKKPILISTALLAVSSAIATDSPNIILIMADDLGWGDVGFNGNTIIKTPHLDALATEGVVFDRFYTACAVSSPTRNSCLTGRNPYRTGIFHA